MKLKKLKKNFFISVSIFSSVVLCPIQIFATPTTSAEAKSELTELESTLQDNLNEINELETTLIELGEKIQTNQNNLEKAKKEQEKQYENTKSVIQFLYENNTDNLKLEKIMESKSLASLTSDLDYINKIEEYSNDKLNEYKEATKKVENIQNKLEKEQTELKEKEEELQLKNNDLETQISEKKIELSDLLKKEANAQKTEIQIGVNYTISNNASAAEKIVAAAYSKIGLPYVWGATGPNAYDCSGFTQYCYSQAGISIPRTSGPQGQGTRVSNPEPGDLVCYPGHVAIYIGNGMMIAAPKSGDYIRIQNVYGNPWYCRWW